MITQEAIDILSQSVAEEVFRDTGLMTGHAGKLDAHAPRVVFTFKVGVDRYSFPIVTVAELEAAHSWQKIFETMVRQVLSDTSPWALAQRIAKAHARELIEPDVPPVIDQQGRRHHRLKAEMGALGALFNGHSN